MQLHEHDIHPHCMGKLDLMQLEINPYDMHLNDMTLVFAGEIRSKRSSLWAQRLWKEFTIPNPWRGRYIANII